MIVHSMVFGNTRHRNFVLGLAVSLLIAGTVLLALPGCGRQIIWGIGTPILGILAVIMWKRKFKSEKTAQEGRGWHSQGRGRQAVDGSARDLT
jgi:hypothetical protein